MTAEQTRAETETPQVADPLGLTAYVKERAFHHLKNGGKASTLLAEAITYRYPTANEADLAKNLMRLGSWVDTHGLPDFGKVIRWAERVDREDTAAAPTLPEQFEACADDEAALDRLAGQFSPADDALLARAGQAEVEPFGLVGILVGEGLRTGRAMVHLYTKDTKAAVRDLAERVFASVGGKGRVRFTEYEFAHVPAPAKPEGAADYPHMRA